MEVECKQCHRKFTDRVNDRPMKMYVHKGEAICADCFMAMGVLPDHDPDAHNALLTESVRYLMRPW